MLGKKYPDWTNKLVFCDEVTTEEMSRNFIGVAQPGLETRTMDTLRVALG